MFEKKPKIIDLETIEDISKPKKIVNKPIIFKISSAKVSMSKNIGIVKTEIKETESKVGHENRIDSGDDIPWL